MFLFRNMVAGALLLSLAMPVLTAEGSVSGFFAGELRIFPEAPLGPNQLETFQPSAIIAPEFRYRSQEGSDQFTFAPFVRLDAADGNRLHFDIREAYWLHQGDGWDLTAGLSKVFWGVAESRHLVDVINQTDLVEDIDEEDKLGQPMVNLNVRRGWGTFSFFLLPGFRERTFPGDGGRPQLPLPVAADRSVFESSLGRKHIDFALRYSHAFGDWDVGVSYFRGTGREPRLVPDVEQNTLVPHYDLINQGGLDLQYTYNAWLFKFEGILREGQGETFGAAVGGFEYTLYQLFGGQADLGLLFEYQYDGRDERAPVTIAQDDFFAGARLALNGSQGASVLGGLVVDRDSGSTLVLVEAERRLPKNLKVEFEGRIFARPAITDPLYAFRQDSFISLRILRFF